MAPEPLHRQTVQEFITTRRGYRLATSTGGVLTGRGADVILIDDPLKPEEALSDAQRRNRRRKSRDSMRTGRKKPGRQEIHRSPIERDAAARHDNVDVRVMGERRAPAMQHRSEADLVDRPPAPRAQAACRLGDGPQLP
jgi:hypothetical protein